MSNKNEKKGFFGRLFGEKKDKKSSCCCNIELEEIPEECCDKKDANEEDKVEKNSSCNE